MELKEKGKAITIGLDRDEVVHLATERYLRDNNCPQIGGELMVHISKDKTGDSKAEFHESGLTVSLRELLLPAVVLGSHIRGVGRAVSHITVQLKDPIN